MSERITRRSLLAEPLIKFRNNDPAFRLNKVALLLKGARVKVDENTWVSGAKRLDGTPNAITIGAAPIPAEVARRWGLESSSKDEQFLFKISHELAHQFQIEKGHERALTQWLDGEDTIASEHVPYIELYAVLSETGPVTGLPTSTVYRTQSEKTGRLKMEILEDITELISAYFLGDEYFTEKISRSLSMLTQDQSTFIKVKIIELCRELH